MATASWPSTPLRAGSAGIIRPCTTISGTGTCPRLPTWSHWTGRGRRIDAVAQVTKLGVVFVLDRDTGEPLFPVEERPVPASDLEGEEGLAHAAVSPQAAPLLPPVLHRGGRSRTSLPAPERPCWNAFARVRTGHIFEPPSTQGTLVFPGFNGGAEWGGAAFDASSGRLYVNSSEIPWILTMISTRDRRLPEAVRRFPRLPGPLCELPWGPAARESPPL